MSPLLSILGCTRNDWRDFTFSPSYFFPLCLLFSSLFFTSLPFLFTLHSLISGFYHFLSTITIAVQNIQFQKPMKTTLNVENMFTLKIVSFSLPPLTQFPLLFLQSFPKRVWITTVWYIFVFLKHLLLEIIQRKFIHFMYWEESDHNY